MTRLSLILCVMLLTGAAVAPDAPPAPVAKKRAQPATQGAAAAQNLALLKAAAAPQKRVVVEWYWAPSTNYAYIVQRSTNLVTWQSVTGYSAATGNLSYPIRFRFTNNLPCEFFRRLEVPLFHVDLKKL